MNYRQTKFKKESRWICPSCNRKNDKTDEICGFCRKPKTVEKTKFNSKRTDYNGRWYQSKLEANYAQQLDWLLKAGDIKEWQPQVKLEFKVNGIKICNHYVDFRVVTKQGIVQYHETKGLETDVYRIKKRLLLALLPEIEPGAEYIVIK